MVLPLDFLEAVAQDLHITNPYVSAAQFKTVLDRARVWQYPWGVIFTVGNDAHIHVLSSYRKRVFFRKELREVAEILFSEYSELVTKIGKDKPSSLDFNQRIGWKLTGEDDNYWLLKMDKKDFNDVWKL